MGLQPHELPSAQKRALALGRCSCLSFCHSLQESACQPPNLFKPHIPNHIPLAQPPPPTSYNLTSPQSPNPPLTSNHQERGPKARPIPAWGNAPGYKPGPTALTALPKAGVQPQAERPNCLLLCHHEPQARQAKPSPSAQDNPNKRNTLPPKVPGGGGGGTRSRRNKPFL
jgi:hypothetical protein